jgi:hypothetical protein
VKKVLISLAGARNEILVQCPTEQVRFQSLGWAILITSGLATVSMWFALNSVLGLNVVVAFMGAVLWGLVIMGIDRWLITSMPADGRRKLAMALPRVVLAILLGTLISTPIVLRIFQPEINAQIAVIKAQRANAYLESQQNSPVTRQVTKWTASVSNLDKVIDSGGEAAINPANDPVVRGLTKQRATEQVQARTYLQEWNCQLYGGANCPSKGPGQIAAAAERQYHAAVRQVNSLTAQIQARDKQLSATDVKSRQARLQQARLALPSARQQLAAATAQQTQLRATFEAQNEKTNGLLIRLTALSQLTNTGFTLAAARFLLFLLFLVIECLPVTVKILQRPGNYERILVAAQEQELRNARRLYTQRPARSSSPGATLVNTEAPTEKEVWPPADNRAQAAAQRAARDSEIRNLWRREAPTWAGGTSAQEQAAHGAAAAPSDSAEFFGLDDAALRGMEDPHDGLRGESADSNRQNGGIELRYADDDL